MNSTTRRPLNVSHLVMGLVFLGIAGTWALHEAGVVDGTDVEWLVPLSLIVAGVLGLVAFAARNLRRGPAGRGGDLGDTPHPYDTDDTTDGETR